MQTRNWHSSLGRKLVVPAEYEAHYNLYVACAKLAKDDILNANVKSRHFKTAVHWLTEGWGYQMMCEFTPQAWKIREHWLEVAKSRRDAVDQDRDCGCSPVSVS